MVAPNAHYAIVGVLREVFGFSDDELARFAQAVGARFQIAEKTSGRGTVPDILNLLTRLRLTNQQQPLFSTVQEIVRQTQLRERLRSLPPEIFPELGAELDKLLSAAATAETGAVSLVDFSHSLSTHYHAIRETHPSTTNAIQLITVHKAKGSEWQAVIVPFLTRKVWGASPRYPTLIQTTAEQQPQLVFDKADADELKDELELADRHEMERLLYVALTRAKHTLVLANDREFFKKANGSIHSNSLIKWLRADAREPNEQHLAALSVELSACGETAHRQQMIPREETRENFGRRETGWIDCARQSAGRFIRTLSPSKFAAEEAVTPIVSDDAWIEMEPELLPPRIDNPATRYGVWWHDFAERIPWLSDAKTWDEVFAAHHARSPDLARSAREWRRLRERVTGLSDFGASSVKKALVVRAEMPFFWKMRDDCCLEGVIDLAIFDPEAGAWLIVDWKTNRIERNKINTLRTQYRPQLAAYCQVVKRMTGHEVKAALYATFAGEFVRYEPQELSAEWERLEKLPPGEPFAELSDQ
jgi:ATP-dependent exoDNAse (exonuclease V) beta subunit